MRLKIHELDQLRQAIAMLTSDVRTIHRPIHESLLAVSSAFDSPLLENGTVRFDLLHERFPDSKLAEQWQTVTERLKTVDSKDAVQLLSEYLSMIERYHSQLSEKVEKQSPLYLKLGLLGSAMTITILL